MKIGDKVVIYNREKKCPEIGTIVDSYRREKIRRYDVLLERGIRLDFLSTDSTNTFYIDEDRTNKFFQKRAVKNEN